MGKPAARVTDMHICPKTNPGPVPHVGGPIAVGSPTVLIGSIPAARVGDMAVCVGPPDKINTGSSGVFINGKSAARLGDSTAHGGKIIVGYPTVLIGGGGSVGSTSDTVGSTLGNPAAGLTAFNNLAATRASGSVQQSYGNCGIESARQIIDVATSNPGKEIDVLQNAINNGNAKYDSTDPNNSGGTSPQDRQNILASKGVSSHLEDQNPQNIQQAVIEGKGVVTSHDAGVLWGDPNYIGDSHAVLVTGVKYDSSGKVSHYVINDTGAGQGSREVPVTQFENSLNPNRNINVTDNPIW